jgi:hypothetical protein
MLHSYRIADVFTNGWLEIQEVIETPIKSGEGDMSDCYPLPERVLMVSCGATDYSRFLKSTEGRQV